MTSLAALTCPLTRHGAQLSSLQDGGGGGGGGCAPRAGKGRGKRKVMRMHTTRATPTLRTLLPSKLSRERSVRVGTCGGSHFLSWR